MEEKKVMETEQVVTNEEQNKTVEAGEQQQDQAKKENRIVGFFKKNGKKIAGIGAIVGAVGAGMAIDHFGLKLPIGKKKSGDEEVTAED